MEHMAPHTPQLPALLRITPACRKHELTIPPGHRGLPTLRSPQACTGRHHLLLPGATAHQTARQKAPLSGNSKFLRTPRHRLQECLSRSIPTEKPTQALPRRGLHRSPDPRRNRGLPLQSTGCSRVTRGLLLRHMGTRSSPNRIRPGLAVELLVLPLRTQRAGFVSWECPFLWLQLASVTRKQSRSICVLKTKIRSCNSRKDTAYDKPEQSANQQNYYSDVNHQLSGTMNDHKPTPFNAKPSLSNSKVQYSAQPQMYDNVNRKLSAGNQEAGCKAADQSSTNSAAIPPEIQRILHVTEEAEQLEQEVDEFVGKKTDKSYRLLEEMLTKLLLELDSIETGGQDSVRQARKEAVHRIQAILEKLERKGL
ncbi:BAG family molecular chaperone regulator 4 isoform X4 [Struthio camelus]